jgi:hypothetical protein
LLPAFLRRKPARCAERGGECEQPERCELLGCLGPARIATADLPAAVAAILPPERAADMPELTALERAVVRATDKLFGVTLAREPAPLTVPQLIAEAMGEPEPLDLGPYAAPYPENTVSDTPAPAAPTSWSAPPTTLKPASRPRDVRVVSVPTGGFVLVEDNAPVAVALDAAGAGIAIVKVLGG